MKVSRRRSLLLAVLLFTAVARAGPSPQDLEAQWRVPHDRGLEALRRGRYDDAARSFREAVLEAEELGPESYRLAESLGALAQTLNLTGDYEEAALRSGRSLEILRRILHPQDPVIAIHRSTLAESDMQLGRFDDAGRLYRLALPVLETALGAAHPDVLRSLDRLAAIAVSQNNHGEAARFYERLLAARWGGEPGETTVAALDALAALLRIAHFQDEERDDAVQAFLDVLDDVGPSPAVYIAGSRLLFRQQLLDTAEEVMSRAVRRFPDSRRVRTELAELYAGNNKLQSALEVFEQALGLGGPENGDPDGDRRERVGLLVRVGHMHIELGQFDEAAAAFQRALDILPEAMDARLELAGQYLVRNMLEEAQAEYARVVDAAPETADAHYGLAELYLRLDRFDDAAESAQRALDADPEHQRARYTRVRALARAGRTAEGEQELAEYQRREAIARDAANREVQVSAINRSGAAALVEGRADRAIELFSRGIEEQPGAAMIYLNLGVAFGKRGQHEAAIATFQSMLDRGCCPLGDSYLVHKSLVAEYGALGDETSAMRHRALYLREYNRALGAVMDRR